MLWEGPRADIGHAFQALPQQPIAAELQNWWGGTGCFHPRELSGRLSEIKPGYRVTTVPGYRGSKTALSKETQPYLFHAF